MVLAPGFQSAKAAAQNIIGAQAVQSGLAPKSPLDLLNLITIGNALKGNILTPELLQNTYGVKDPRVVYRLANLVVSELKARNINAGEGRIYIPEEKFAALITSAQNPPAPVSSTLKEVPREQLSNRLESTPQPKGEAPKNTQAVAPPPSNLAELKRSQNEKESKPVEGTGSIDITYEPPINASSLGIAKLLNKLGYLTPPDLKIVEGALS